MILPNSLRVAAGFALLLPLLPAYAADEPDAAETMAYITARCTGAEWRVPADSDFVNKTMAISLSGTTLTHTKTFTLMGSRDTSKYNHVGQYDLRKVDIRWVAHPDTTPFIKLHCADLCVRNESWREGQNTHTVSPLDGDSFYCRDGEKVFRAFKHLQGLLGGKEKDPFAN
ncbi:hypothetical protein [Kordiimonas aestuarii]|uniref:hypothetical protein n=1 Tax=Kordiimonas aestuarii TaxID=1005925 RepID=UPI0021D0B9D4|nr:hypothetical protein [Kordiimonas aestuarii]